MKTIEDPEFLSILIEENKPYGYKELCELLDDAYYKNSGNARKKQILNWSRYFDFIKTVTKDGKKGRKFIIKEIYKEPKPETIKNRNSKYISLVYWLLLNDEYEPDVMYKSQLLTKLGFYSYRFKKSQGEKGIDNQAISFIYAAINQKYKSVIKSLKKNLLIEHEEFIMAEDLNTREIREPTLEEVMTITECEDTAIFKCYKSIAQCNNPRIPEKRQKAIAIIVMYGKLGTYLELKNKEIEKRLNIKIHKFIKYSVIDNPGKEIDFSEIEADEDLQDDYGVISWERVRQKLNDRINESLYESLEKRMKNKKEKRRFSEEVAAEIKELIELNYIPLSVYTNDNSDYEPKTKEDNQPSIIEIDPTEAKWLNECNAALEREEEYDRQHEESKSLYNNADLCEKLKDFLGEDINKNEYI